MRQLWVSLPAWQALAGLLAGVAVGASLVAVPLVGFGFDVRDLFRPATGSVYGGESSFHQPISQPQWPAEDTENPPRYVFRVPRPLGV